MAGNNSIVKPVDDDSTVIDASLNPQEIHIDINRDLPVQDDPHFTSTTEGNRNGMHQRGSRHRGYVQRRMDLFNSQQGEEPGNDIIPGSVITLPIPIQIGFRQKMLGIFAFQLLLVWILVSISAYDDNTKTLAGDTFNVAAYTAIPFVVLILCLVILYVIRERFPLNWIVLLLFSIAQSVFFASLNAVFKTNVGSIACGFTFFELTIMVGLSGVMRKQSDGSSKLLSSFRAGIIGYGVVGGFTTILFIALGERFLTPIGFTFVMISQLVMVIWFSSDANAMYKVMTPDEYMHGVIYFYTDFILLVIVCAIFAGIIGLSTICGAEGADMLACGFYGGNCDCCLCCYACSGDHTNNGTQQQEDEENQIIAVEQETLVDHVQEEEQSTTMVR